MPPVFKTLASIIAWILFVVGCVGVVYFYVSVGLGECEPIAMAMGVASLILSVCAMRLRQKME